MNIPVSDWIKSNQELSDLMVNVCDNCKNVEEAALIAFYQVSDIYNLPKFPDEITEEIYAKHEELDLEPRSVFEELAIINYLMPDKGLRDRVLQALYNVHHRQYTNIDRAAAKYYGLKKIPKEYFVYYFGKDIDAKITFEIENGRSWFDAGAKIMTKVFH